MSHSDRNQKIIKYLTEHKSATVEELARFLYVSEATIRRDLTVMQKLGQIGRSHGGAIISEGTDELSIFIRQTKNAKEKIAAGTIALKHIPNVQSIFIDNSSTCLALASRMDFSRKLVVTNGLQVAMQLSHQNIAKLIILGGEIHEQTTAAMGGITLSAMNDFRFDLAILSCSAIDTEGSYELSLDAMQIKRAAIARSNQRFLIFDNTKLKESSAYRTAGLDVYDALITDAEDEALTALRTVHSKVYNT